MDQCGGTQGVIAIPAKPRLRTNQNQRIGLKLSFFMFRKPPQNHMEKAMTAKVDIPTLRSWNPGHPGHRYWAPTPCQLQTNNISAPACNT
ncbi:MAG: hypothetical protein CML06_12940 [Pseudomonadales bacterium]|nr:hypothetical protein [Pseudomonadales bacterium]